jgi:hypothetical protein
VELTDCGLELLPAYHLRLCRVSLKGQSYWHWHVLEILELLIPPLPEV